MTFYNKSKYRIYFLVSVFFILPCFPSWLSSKVQVNNNVYQEQFGAEEENLLSRVFYKDKIAEIDSLMQYYHRRYRFHGNVLVAYKNNVIYQKAFGSAEFKKDRSLTNQTAFELASVSKQFTAAAIMMLEERGWLHYDDPVKMYLPQLPYKGIKIRHLLNHTAGLPNYMWLLEHHWPKETLPYNDEVVDLMAQHHLNLYFRPGHYFHYSNTGYMLLAAVIEKVSGKRYNEFLEENIFTPLGMENTFVNSAAHPKKIEYPEAVFGYRWSRWGYRKIPETVNDGTVGDKGIYSTTMDLYKWTKALHEGKVLNEASLDKAFNHDKKDNYYRSSYGYGFRIRKKDDKEIIYHNGIWSGFRTTLKHYLPEGNTLILLNHTDNHAKRIVVRRLERILNESSDRENTFQLVKSVLKDKNKGESQYLNRLVSNDDLHKIDPIRIRESAKVLRQDGKYQLAARLGNLFDRVSHWIVRSQLRNLQNNFEQSYPSPSVSVSPG